MKDENTLKKRKEKDISAAEVNTQEMDSEAILESTPLMQSTATRQYFTMVLSGRGELGCFRPNFRGAGSRRGAQAPRRVARA